MDKKQYTPSKIPKLTPPANPYHPPARESYRNAGQPAIIREFQILKQQARQLENQNRQLATDVQKLKYEKNVHENKLTQKGNFEEETLGQMQKEKNYHIEMIKLKNSEEISRMKREYELKIEDLQRESRSREALSREIAEKNGSLESKSGELRGVLDGLEMEMRRFRDKNSSLSEQLTIEEFANKKLEMLAEELERQKNDMENEIHLILDIELEKSNDLSLLEDRLANSETSEKNLTQKLAQLTDNFLNLEGHISSMKDRLSKADLRGEELGKKIRSVEELIRSKEMLIAEQKDRLLSLREEIEAHKDRENQSLLQIEDLMSENERVYHELVFIRHQLYEVSIDQGIDI